MKIDFFRKRNGEAPVRDFLRALPKHDRVQVGRDLRKLQDGTRRGMPYERNLGRGYPRHGRRPRAGRYGSSSPS